MRSGDTLGKVLFGFAVEKALERFAMAFIGALLWRTVSSGLMLIS